MTARLSEELKVMLGERKFVALVEAFGGTRLYIPSRMTADHDIANAVGVALARKLSSRYSPATLRVPLAREERARHYRAEGLSNAAIAKRLGMTEPGVDQLFARIDAPAKGSNQLSLFAD